MIPRAMVVDSYEGGKRHIQVRVDADPAAMVFKKSVHSPVHAWICGQCGYIELYADDPAELYKAFTEAQSTMTHLG